MKKLKKLQVWEKELMFMNLNLIVMEHEEIVKKNIQDYNKAVRQINDFISGIREEMQIYYDERSDRWKESDNGELYEQWMDAWDIEIDEIESFDEIEDFDHNDLYDEP